MLVGALLAFGVYLVILVITAYAATRPPRTPLFLSPEVAGVFVENVEIESDGLVLRGWFAPHPSPRAIVLLFHGYVMNRSENAGIAADLNKAGFASVLVDFRAHGKSDGSVCGIGWLERRDVLAVCRYVADRFPSLPRILVGSSMGAAACAFALAEEPDCAQAAVLDSAYCSLPSATLGWWRFIGGRAAAIMLAPVILVAWPMVRFNPFRVNVSRALQSISKPLLVIHGDSDTLVHVNHSHRNFERANEPKELKIVSGASHSESRWLDPAGYKDTLVAFIETFVLRG